MPVPKPRPSAQVTEESALASIFDYVRIPKPMFYSDTTDSSRIIVQAIGTPISQAVLMGSQVYVNAANKVLDLDTSGRNGLDTGSKAANTIYYLYAIPTTSGVGFDVVCSIAGPLTGPSGFSLWSYLGSFWTNNAATSLPYFVSRGGRFLSMRWDVSSHTGDTNWTSKSVPMPVTVKASLGMLIGTGAGAWACAVSGIDSPGNAVYQVLSTAIGVTAPFIEVPIFTPGTLYLKGGNNAATTEWYQSGWVEDPQEYQ